MDTCASSILAKEGKTITVLLHIRISAGNTFRLTSLPCIRQGEDNVISNLSGFGRYAFY